jgi:hypothetical protein
MGLAAPLAPSAAQPATAPPVGRPCARLYVVVHKVMLDADGQVATTSVEQILDPSAWPTPEEATNHPIQLDLPEAYLAAVRVFLNGRPRQPGAPNPYYTYTFFDPAQPGRAGIGGPADCRPVPAS